MLGELTPGSVKIKNVSGGVYNVAELAGLVMADQDTIDLLDVNLTPHYESFEAAKWLVTKGVSSQLYQDIQSGSIEIVEMTPPKVQ